MIDVIAVITAQGEHTMNGIPAEPANIPPATPPEPPKLLKKPRVAAPKANVAPSKARSGNKAAHLARVNGDARA